MNAMFSSLAIPNYRRYFFGCLSGNTGNWMSMTAKSWLVLVELTANSATTLGWLTTVMFLPQFFFQPIGGMLADKLNKRMVLLTTQILLCLSATTLSILVISGHAKLWHVFFLAAFDGAIAGFDQPARAALVSELVPIPQLANAISLNSASWNAARLFGPGVAGIVIAVFGTGHTFVINAASFLLLIFMLLRMEPDKFFRQETAKPKQKQRALDGVRYVVHRPQIALLFFIAFMLGTFGFNYTITNSLMSTVVFDKGPGQYGMLGSIMGIGALLGALLAARRERPRIRHIVGFCAGFAASICLSAIAPNFIVFAILMVPMGLCGISVMVTANSMVQISVPQAVRGRVMALWGIAFMGLTPVVSPILGVVGDTMGARAAVWVGGIAILITFLFVIWWLFIRQGIRLYHTDGIHFRVWYPGDDDPPQHKHDDLPGDDLA